MSRVSLSALLVIVLSVMFGASSAFPSFDLASSSNYALFSYAGITNSGATTITGNIGIYPNAANVTGYSTVTLHGVLNIANPAALAAQDDLKLAYTYVNGLPCNASVVNAEMGGTTFYPGVWCFSPADVTLTNAVTLSGPAGSVWIFIITGTFTVANGASVVMTGGATACGVLFTVAGSSGTAIGSGVTFQGTVIGYAGITVNTGSTITNGRLFSKTALITLLSNTITNAACVSSTTSSSSTGSAISSSSGGASSSSGSTVSSSSGVVKSSSTGAASSSGTQESSTAAVDSSTASDASTASSASESTSVRLSAILGVSALFALAASAV